MTQDIQSETAPRAGRPAGLFSTQVQTAVAIFSAFGFVAGLKDISHFARILIGSFDYALDFLAGKLKDLISLPFDIATIKAAFLYAPIVVFFLSGLLQYRKTKRLYVSTQDLIVSVVAQAVLFTFWIYKTLTMNGGGILQKDFYSFDSGTFLPVCFVVVLLFYAIIATPVFLYLRKGLKVGELKSFFLTLLACSIGPAMFAALGFAAYIHFSSGIYQGFFMNFMWLIFFVVFAMVFAVLGLFVIAPVIILPQLMIFNPLRLKQVALFIVILVGLALVSVPIEKTLLNLEDHAAPAGAIEDTVPEEGAR